MARVFISYSHKDEDRKDRLLSQLGVLADEGLKTGDDRRIAAGDDWLPGIEQAIATCVEVAQRAARTLAWVHKAAIDQLRIALDQLTQAGCTLYAHLLRGRPPGEEARREFEAAVSGLRAAGQQYIPRCLLTRAWLRHASGDTSGAEVDLREAGRIVPPRRHEAPPRRHRPHSRPPVPRSHRPCRRPLHDRGMRLRPAAPPDRVIPKPAQE